MPAFLCRDCDHETGSVTAGRCPACGSPRTLSHPELDELAIAHVDCDAFYAAIEKHDDPRLRDRPVIVGGGVRGVVATACYEARIFGVRSAMPMFKALKACPHAAVVKPRMERYAEVGRTVRRMMLELTPLVQPISIDEAFLDLAGTTRLHGRSAARSLVRFAIRVERELGITVSVGLSCNKFLAKVASDHAKPRGFTVIGRREAAAFLAPQPISVLPGVGQKAADRLARAGLRRVGDLLVRPPDAVAAAIGTDATRLIRLAQGDDDRPVHTRREAKTVSAETTMSIDLSDSAELEPVLWRLCERVSARLKAAELAGASVTLKLKDRSFRLRTRTRSGLEPTQLATRLYACARDLLAREADGTAFRLIGIGAGDLCGVEHADRGDLADGDVAETAAMESALDRIRQRFGPESVQKGFAFRWRSKAG